VLEDARVKSRMVFQERHLLSLSLVGMRCGWLACWAAMHCGVVVSAAYSRKHQRRAANLRDSDRSSDFA
jgi:hypothetical protein